MPNGVAKVVGRGTVSALAAAASAPPPCSNRIAPLASAERAYCRGEYKRAAAFVEEAASGLVRIGDWATVIGWADRLPEPILAGHPWLCLAHAWRLIEADRLEKARDALARLTAWPDGAKQLDPGFHAAVAALEALVAAGIAEAEARRRRISDALARLIAATRDHHPHIAATDMKTAPCATDAAYGLTQREIEVLGFVSRGLSNRELASRLDLSETTVKWHLRNIFGKLGVANRTEAVFSARNSNLIA